MSVGFTPTDPVEQLRRAYTALNELRKALKNARRSFDKRNLRQVDTELANAWLISDEIKRRLADAGERLKQHEP